MGEPVSGVLVASVTSVAVTVQVPVLSNVTLKVAVPSVREAFGGRMAVLSLLVMLISLVAPLT